MSERLFQGRTALVTGGARGIGRAICQMLGEQGARVAINYAQNHEAALETLASIETIAEKVIVVQADVSQPDDVARMIETVRGQLGPIDLLINNAGIASTVHHSEINYDNWKRMFAVNVDEEVKKGTQHAHFEIDGSRGDCAGVLLALLTCPFDLVVVDVGPGDRFDVAAAAEMPLEVFEYFRIATVCFGFVGGVDANVIGEHGKGVFDWSCSAFLRRREFLPGCEKFSDKFILFATLGLSGLARCLADKFSFAFWAFPPLDEVIPGPLVPNVTVASFAHRDEFPVSGAWADFFDDADALLESHLGSPSFWTQALLGVCFSELTDTKMVS